MTFLKTLTSRSMLGFILLLSLSFACQKADTPTPLPETMILPGEGVENVKIGDSGQSIVDKYGDVADSWFGGGTSYIHFLIYFDKGLTFFFEPVEHEDFKPAVAVLNYIAISDPFDGKTTGDIGIGSSKEEVKAQFGEPDDKIFGDDHYDIGIRFGYDGDGFVEEMTVVK